MLGLTISIIAIILAGAIVGRLLVWSVWRAFSPRWSRTEHPALFFALVCFSLLALRWPQISWAHEINVDESQMLAQGLRFLSHPVPWRDVDGTTSGPINSLLLSLPLYFGAPFSWQTARIALWLLICLTLIFTYLSLRCFGTRLEAQFALMPTILFFAFALHRDFIHYSSEMPSVALLSAGIYLLAREWCAGQSSSIRWFLLGLLMGCVPFAKLQVAPVALLLVLVGMVQLFARFRAVSPPRKFPWRDLAALCLGGVLMPGLIMGVVVFNGAFADFWKSYILAGRAYAAHESIRAKFENLLLVLFHTLDFRLYLIGAMMVSLLAFIPFGAIKARLGRRLFWPLMVILADCVVTLLCILVAGRNHYHYALLLVPAFAILFGLSLLAGKAIWTVPGKKESWAYPCWLAAFVGVAIGLQFYKISQYFREVDNYLRLGHVWLATLSPVSTEVLKAKRPGDTVSIWGWMPAYYVESGLMPATRDAIGHFLLEAGPYRDYYRTRYLTDLEKTRPPLFVDAIADNTFLWPGMSNMTHECFPDLAKFINNNYTLWRTIHLTEDDQVGASPVRIYLARQRMAALHASPAEFSAPSSNPPQPP